MFKKVAVIGAGVMGAGIACQIANNKTEVLLYDLENENGLIAEQAIQKQLSSPSSQLTHKTSANYITPLSLTNDLDMIRDADLIIEAIIENLDIKHKLYKNLSTLVKKDTIIASNTSTFRLENLKKDLEENFSKNMVICHFFNPPRLQRLLELVPGKLDQKQTNNLISFLSDKLGKDVVLCKDTPGFIANRLGCFLMELTLDKTLATSYKIEEIDYIFTKYLGFPSTGIFGLYDLIGLDVMKLISKSLKSSLPKSDLFNEFSNDNPQISKLISDGYIGRKGKGGFYKVAIDQETGVKTKYALDLTTFEYRPSIIANFSDVSYNEFIANNDHYGKLLDDVMNIFFDYVISINDEIADNIYDIDKAMQLGFAWKKGPFELMLDFSIIDEEQADEKIDRTKFGVNCKSLKNKITQLQIKPIEETQDTKLWRISTNKLCLEITSKMHVLTKSVFRGIISAVSYCDNLGCDLLIYSDFDHFSAGADLREFYRVIENNDKDSALNFLELGQKAMLSLKYSKNPVISCARGVALGGGCEILLHSDYVIAHQELQAGLVETSLGLIPGWGGLKEMVLRSNSENIEKHLNLIFSSYKSSSAIDFAINFNHKNVIIESNRNNLLDYAINNKFDKIYYNSDSEVLIQDIKINPKNNISEILLLELDGSLNETKLLNLEKKIFSKLLFTEYVKEKIQKLI